MTCKKKRGEENERWIKEAQKARTEKKVWEIVNIIRRGEGERGLMRG